MKRVLIACSECTSASSSAGSYSPCSSNTFTWRRCSPLGETGEFQWSRRQPAVEEAVRPILRVGNRARCPCASHRKCYSVIQVLCLCVCVSVCDKCSNEIQTPVTCSNHNSYLAAWKVSIIHSRSNSHWYLPFLSLSPTVPFSPLLSKKYPKPIHFVL